MPGREYKGRLYINIKTKRSLHFRPEWLHVFFTTDGKIPGLSFKELPNTACFLYTVFNVDVQILRICSLLGY